MTAAELGEALDCARKTLAAVDQEKADGRWGDLDVAERHGRLLHALRHLLDAVEAKPGAARLDVAGVYGEYMARWGYSTADARAAVLQEVEEALDRVDDEGGGR